MHQPQPLPADPRRQANAMLTACDYQIWQTVSAWLDLRSSDTLYVEGAEDFDTVGTQHAETVQVKAAVKPISLAHAEVQHALNNFWTLRQATPLTPVRFRFLTRARFTVERKAPFGKAVAGLELWDRSILTDVEVQLIIQFLVRQKHISSDLRVWLQTASITDIRLDLIDRVVWQTHAEDIEFLERSVYGKLTAFAETRGHVPPATKIKQIAHTLVAEVWKTLRRPAPRLLDHFRLLELWDEATRISVPQVELDARILQAPPPMAIPAPEIFRRGLPPLPGVVAKRGELVDRMRDVLGVTGLLNFHGSTRTGKTTLAKLTAISDADTWHWWSSARKPPSEIRREVALLLQETARRPDIVSIILDDIDFSPTAVRAVEDALGELLAIIRGRRGRALITSQKPLPPSLRHAFNVTAQQVIIIPRLDVREIESFRWLSAALTIIARVSGAASFMRRPKVIRNWRQYIYSPYGIAVGLRLPPQHWA